MHFHGQNNTCVQNAIHSKPHTQLLIARLNMNVGGASFLRMPQNDRHHLTNRRLFPDTFTKKHFSFNGRRQNRLSFSHCFFFQFSQCFCHFTPQPTIFFKHILKIGPRNKENTKWHFKMRRDKLKRFPCFQIFRRDHTDLKHIICKTQR